MKLYKYLTTALITLLFASCNLDESPKGLASFWNSKEDAEIGLDAAYEPFYFEDGYGRGQYWVGGISDDMIYNRGRSNEDPLAAFTATENNSGGIYNMYKYMYRTIRRANDAMEYIPNITMDDSDRNRMLAEANFLTGFAYFQLAQRFGGVPFYHFEDKGTINKPRETKTETYKRIIAYLEKSAELYEKLPSGWQPVNNGRPSLGAAYGLIAKVYAHWGKYDLAKTAAEKVIGKYSLNKTGDNGFKNLFSPAGEKHEEVLFNLNNIAVRHQGTITSVVLLSGTMSGGTGWFYFAPTQDLYASFEDGDLRREVTMKGSGDEVSFPALVSDLQKEENKKAAAEGRDPVVIKAPITITSDMIRDMNTGYMCTKFATVYEGLPGWDWEAGADIPLLRYSDVLLIHAEAEIFLAGGGASNRDLGVAAAAKSFNEVRVRAFGGDTSKEIASPSFNDLVIERRNELAYEGNRHFDLVRWGLAKEYYANPSDPRGARAFDPVKHAHIYFPQGEIQLTGGMVKNNPLEGYSTFGAN